MRIHFIILVLAMMSPLSALGFAEMSCQILNPYAHPKYAIISSVKVKRQIDGQDWLLATSKPEKKVAIGELRRTDQWIYGHWAKGGTWLSLAREKMPKAKKGPRRKPGDGRWIGAIVFGSQYDYELSCAEMIAESQL